MGVEEYVVDTMYSVASDVVEKAGYDKTIQAQIVSCQDATIGKYRCRYQDAVFYAYSNNIDLMLSNNASVYVLVPNGDFKQEKTILGTTQKLGIDFISLIQGEDGYQKIGINCVNSDSVYYLDSNNRDYKYILYRYADKYDQQNGTYVAGDYVIYDDKLYICTTDIETPQSFNSNYWSEVENEGLDIESIEQYIHQSSSVILGATFKTSIPTNRQYKGHYGIRFNLAFRDNAAGNTVIRSYEVNEDNMIDNPYRLIYPTRQYQVFDIDSDNFLRVDSIEIFNNDFPNAAGNITSDKLNSGDIQITKLELTNALHLSDSQLTGIAITFFTPQGTFFTNRSMEGDQKTITAQVRVKGKLVSSAQKIQFYWGKENVNITAENLSYNKHLGRGWQCLNDSNIIQDENNSEPIVEWVPGTDTIYVNFEESTAKDNRYKVAVVYNNTVVTKEINIKNLDPITAQVKITSDGGDTFYYDNGHPNLECSVFIDNVKQSSENYSFHWAYESSEGVFNELPQTTEDNVTYDLVKTTKEDLEAKIASGQKFREVQQDNLLRIQNLLNSYKFIQRVKENHVYDVQIKNIKKFGTFKCSVFNKAGTVYYGTASFTLINSYETEGVYSLVINNGSVVFKYDERGWAPTLGSFDNPQQLQALSFTVYDNLGNALDSNEIITSPRCSVEWGFPIEDTMLVEQADNGSPTEIGQYHYYKNNLVLTYGIANSYSQNKKNNQITLDVDYKGIKLSARTQFTFVKQGEQGTNGTDYVIRLVPNTGMDNPPLFPMVTTTSAGNHYVNYGIGVANPNTESQIYIGPGQTYEYNLFRAQIWKNGDCIWEGFQIGDSIINQHNDGTRPTSVVWEVLQNRYKKGLNNFIDDSDFGITQEGSLHGAIYYKGTHLKPPTGSQTDAFTDTSANIIKCSITIEGKMYYGTIPIMTAWVANNPSYPNQRKYNISLKDNTGFRYVTYTSDGINPQYDTTHPFEFICTEIIDNVEVDISTVSGDHALIYNFNTCSDVLSTVYEGTTKTFRKVSENLLKIRNRSIYNLAANQVACEPKERYDGFCVNAAVLCECVQDGIIVARINVPIHFLLNKYGLSNLNDWDGNHIQINNQSQNGYILAPQIGAGKKDENNGFTGVLMGTVTRNDTQRDNEDIGLMGYSNGDRSFFLNSKNGSAIFGKGEGGKIIIDPSDEIEQIVEGTTTVIVPRNRALLYSDSFWEEYNEDGLPVSYYHTNYNHQGKGMLIDLSTPQIRWGNNNFSVNKEGHLVAQGGGEIAGWLIKDYSLTSKDGTLSHEPSLTLHSGSDGSALGGRIYSGDHTTLTDTDQGFFLSKDGLSIGDKFKVDKEGIVTVGQGATAYDHTLDDQTLRYSLPYKLVGDGTSSGEYKITEEKIFSTRQDITLLVEFVDKQSGNDENPLLDAFDIQGYKGLTVYSEDGRLRISSPPYSSDDKRVHFSYQRNPNKILRFAYTYHPTSNTSQATFNFSIDGEIIQSGIVIDVNGGAYTETVQSTPVVLQGEGFEAITKDLLIGCRYLAFYDDYRYWKGDINKVYIYDSLKDINFINRFLNGEDIIGNQGISKKHWVINANSTNKETYIAYNTSTFLPGDRDSNLRVYFGTDGLSLGKFFSVDSDGSLELKRGNIKLGYDTIANPPQWRFSVDDSGYLEAKRGKIAGIEMWKHGDVSELRAGTTYVDQTTQQENKNILSRGFVLQSNGRVLGVGPQMGFDQTAYDADQTMLAAYYLAYIFAPTDENKRAMQSYETQVQNKINNHQYDTAIKYNMWEFTHDTGIFRGGQTNYVNSLYSLREQNFRIQPANGYSRFQYVDVADQLAVGGRIYGFRDVTYDTISHALTSKITFSVDCQTGELNAVGAINSGIAFNAPEFYINGGTVKYNKSDNFLSIGNGQIALRPNGQIDASGNINAGTRGVFNGYSAVLDSGNGTVKCGQIITTSGTLAVRDNSGNKAVVDGIVYAVFG